MLELLTDDRFQWLIDPTVDTTTNLNDCSYDKIVIAGDVAGYVANGSAGVFRFDEVYGLSFEQTLAVSDHYPVEFSLQTGGTEQLSPSHFSLIFICLFCVFLLSKR